MVWWRGRWVFEGFDLFYGLLWGFYLLRGLLSGFESVTVLAGFGGFRSDLWGCLTKE